MAATEGFEEGASIFSADDADRAYFVNGRQVANTVDDGIELRITRKVVSAHRARFKDDPRIIVRGSSDWMGVRPARVADLDLDLVRELAAMTAEANRPPAGTPPKPPPSGPELERRRKFH